jgi:hypothetical protein
MPTPVYIICSKGGAVDKDAEAVHVFDVVEVIKILPIKVGEQPPSYLDQMTKIRILAAWQMSPDDLGKVFEAEVAVRFPGRETAIPDLVLPKVSDILIVSPIQRVLFGGIAFATLPGPGAMEVECRLRRKGDTDWPWKQTYPILLLEVAQPAVTPVVGVTPPPDPPV